MLTSLPDRIVRTGDARKRIAYMHPFFFAASGCLSWCYTSGERGKICKKSFFGFLKLLTFVKMLNYHLCVQGGFTLAAVAPPM